MYGSLARQRADIEHRVLVPEAHQHAAAGAVDDGSVLRLRRSLEIERAAGLVDQRRGSAVRMSVKNGRAAIPVGYRGLSGGGRHIARIIAVEGCPAEIIRYAQAVIDDGRVGGACPREGDEAAALIGDAGRAGIGSSAEIEPAVAVLRQDDGGRARRRIALEVEVA
ncbi:hypothetical protein [Mesorhizobium sp. M0140]|uniref:hypothetical protein n=1 Tax=Mesorhizobium sp. M0140 TaxID=2956893 RepID=UPI00333BD0F5